MKKIVLFSLQCLLLVSPAFAQQIIKRTIKPSDLYRFKAIHDPQVSPDGKWVAYTITVIDSAEDKHHSEIYMSSWDARDSIRLTFDPENGSSSPKWSPDNKYLAFITERGKEKTSQIWLLNRKGGEAEPLTNVKGDIEDYAWSPDAKQLVLEIKDPSQKDTASEKATPKPIVIDRYKFKQDVVGYLENRHSHLYIFNIADKKLDTLTSGKYDEHHPVWSPNGKLIAFVSNRTEDPDRNQNTDI